MLPVGYTTLDSLQIIELASSLHHHLCLSSLYSSFDIRRRDIAVQRDGDGFGRFQLCSHLVDKRRHYQLQRTSHCASLGRQRDSDRDQHSGQDKIGYGRCHSADAHLCHHLCLRGMQSGNRKYQRNLAVQCDRERLR